MPKAVVGPDQIREHIPHRYPILLIDRIVELGEDEGVGEKLVSANEPVLQGHFPGQPIFPGVYVIEALAQTGAVCIVLIRPEFQGLKPILVGIDKCRFRRPVRPGDLLRLHVRIERVRGNMVKFEGVARVDGETAAEAQLMAALVRWEDGA